MNEPNPKDPYGFILNPEKPSNKNIVAFGGGGMMQRAIIFGAGFIFIIIIIIVGLNFLNRASNEQNQRLLEIVTAQNEIIRISTSAREKVSSKDLQYRSINTRLSISSSKQEFIGALTARGYKIDQKKLLKAQNPQNDALLVEGEQNGNFDETYTALLNQQLENYRILLLAAYESGSQSEKTIIETSGNQLELLGDKSPNQ